MCVLHREERVIHVSELLNGTGTVEARDLTEYKIGLIEENIARVGNENIITKVSGCHSIR